jgi:periplasmic protein TonB
VLIGIPSPLTGFDGGLPASESVGSSAPQAPSAAHVPPSVLSTVNPAYPTLARQQSLEGVVQLRVTVGADGVPRNAEAVSGNRVLVQAARDAVMRWRYRPARRNGVAVEELTTASVEFRLK